MTVKKTVLILSLATGLSVGLLSGCDLPGNQAEPSPSPSAIVSSTGQSTTDADAQRTAAINNHLKALQEKRKDLNAFVENIKVTENGTKVANSVDYVNAQATVNDLASAYKTFKDSLFNEIKQNINFNNIDLKIEPILVGTSQERKILENLASQQYRDAQEKLSQYKIDNQSIYKESDIDGDDGSKQRIATKKLLENILQVTQPLATLTINPNSSSTQDPSKQDSSSSAQSLTTNELKTQLEQLKKDIHGNNWVWPLLNTLALVATAGSFLWLLHKNSNIVLIHEVQNSKVPRGRRPETDIQQLKNEIVTTKNNIQEIRNQLTTYLKNNESEENLTSTLHKIDEVEHELERIYHDVILQHLDSLDPTQDLIRNDRERRLINTSIHQNNLSLQQLDDYFNNLNTKLDQLSQINQQDLSARSSSENSEILNKIRDLFLTHQDNLQKLDNLNVKLYELQISQHNQSLSSFSEISGILKQIQDSIKPIESQSQTLFSEIEELKYQLIQKNENIDSKTIKNKLNNLLQHFQENLQINSGEVEQLRQENQQLSNSSQDLTTQLQRVSTEKSRLEQQCETLNSQVEQLQQNKENLESTVTENAKEIQTLQTEIQTLQMEIERLRKRLKKEAIEPVDIPQWRNVINNYNQSPESIFNVPGVEKQGEVLEDEEKGLERRSNSSKPVVLISNPSPNGFYILSLGNDYLLFPKEHAIAESQKRTASALFDGYKSGNTNKFTLISPAQVTSIGNGMWQLKHRGQLEYP